MVTNNFKGAKKRLKKEAIESGWFDTVTVYGPEILDKDFKEKFKHILSHSRGAGYWIWKLYIIQKKVKRNK